MISKHNKVSLQDWQDLKPYSVTSETDLYYLNISNQIKDKIYFHNLHLPLKKFINEESISLFCVFITSYLEDIISETEIWNSFVKKHQEIYGYPLPFYETKNDYVEKEVNIQDIKFLIWYFINAINKNILLNPKDTFIQNLAEHITSILELEYEYAPENHLLKSHYKIENIEDYTIVKKFLDCILTKTYLFFPDTGFSILRQEEEILKKEKNVKTILNNNREYFIHNAKTSILALSAREWGMIIFENNPSIRKALETLSPYVQSTFLFLGQTETHLELEHIATKKKFNILKSSFPKHKNLKENNIVFIGIIKWLNDWWFSGVSILSNFNEQVIEKEKHNQNAKEALSFMENQSIVQETIKKHHKNFLIYNKNIPIAFLAKNEVENFINKYFAFFEATQNLTDEEKEKAVKKYIPKKIQYEEQPNEIITIFHNHISGFELYSNIENAFHIKQNKFWNEKNAKQNFYQIFLSNYYSREFVEYCIKTNKQNLSFFKNNYTSKDIDFLTRFFKANIYHTKPKLTIIK